MQKKSTGWLFVFSLVVAVMTGLLVFANAGSIFGYSEISIINYGTVSILALLAAIAANKGKRDLSATILGIGFLIGAILFTISKPFGDPSVFGAPLAVAVYSVSMMPSKKGGTVSLPLAFSVAYVIFAFTTTGQHDGPFYVTVTSILALVLIPALAAWLPKRDLERSREEERKAKESEKQKNELLETAQEELKEANAKLERIIVNKDAISQNATHELRSPVIAMITASEMAETDLEQLGKELGIDIPKPLIRRIKGVNNSAHQLLELINDLLDIARIESGLEKINPEEINLIDLVNKVVEPLEPTIQRKGLRIVKKIDGTIITDVEKAKKVMSNFLTNAVKYSSEGGVITVNGWVKDGQASLSVEDNGIGIHPDDKPIIFEQFRQARNSKGGTGIGLALAKGIAELMGGTLSVESTLFDENHPEMPHGSIFTWLMQKEVKATEIIR